MGGVGQVHWVIGTSLRGKARITEKSQGIIKWEEETSSRANAEECVFPGRELQGKRG